MRVGFDARWYNDSGVGTYVAGLLPALAAAGDFDLVVYEDPRRPVPNLSGERLRKQPVRAGKYSLAEQIELARRCRADRLDIFHAPFYIAPWLAPCPVVVTIHDLIPFLFPLYSAPHQWLVKAGYWVAVRRAARIIVVSQHTRRDLVRLLGVREEKISVVSNATAPDMISRSSDDNEAMLARAFGVRSPYLLLLGARNQRTKNPEGAARALCAARRQLGQEFQVVVAGPPEGFPPALTESFDADVVRVGHVDRQQLAQFYRGARVFLLASRYEGFGLPLLEAMACGCPVVCSNAASLPEVAADGAMLADPEDAEAIAQAIVHLWRSETARAELSGRALRRARDFSWERAAREVIAIYRSAADERHPLGHGMRRSGAMGHR